MMDAAFLDTDGVKRLWGEIEGRISGSSEALEVDATLSMKDGTLGVATPVREIVSQAEFDALPEEEKNTGLWVIPDAGGGSGSSSGAENNMYSTEETRIGTWIDGKPLYRKCFKLVLEDLNTSTPIRVTSMSDLSADAITHMYGMMCIPELNSWIPFGYGSTQPSFDENFNFWVNADGILSIKNTTYSQTNCPCICICEYTKTTD